MINLSQSNGSWTRPRTGHWGPGTPGTMGETYRKVWRIATRGKAGSGPPGVETRRKKILTIEVKQIHRSRTQSLGVSIGIRHVLGGIVVEKKRTKATKTHASTILIGGQDTDGIHKCNSCRCVHCMQRGIVASRSLVLTETQRQQVLGFGDRQRTMENRN